MQKLMKVRCYTCGTIIEVTSLERPLKVKCPNCGTVGALRAEQAPSTPPPYTPYALGYPGKKKTGKPLAGGILLIVAGALAIGTWLLIMVRAQKVAIIYEEPSMVPTLSLAV